VQKNVPVACLNRHASQTFGDLPGNHLDTMLDRNAFLADALNGTHERVVIAISRPRL